LQVKTIAALATFPAESAIGIIRVSGPLAIKISCLIFKPSGARPIKPGMMVHGIIHDKNTPIDSAMLCVFRKPRSYTGEDMAEFYCHGNPYILSLVLELLYSHGATAAGPGEFTKRAFLNGKMDLTQAEAVAELVSAKSGFALKAALDQLKGAESRAINGLRKNILRSMSLIETELDMDISSGKSEALKAALDSLSIAESLIKGSEEAIIQKEGVRAVIAGRPNTGKSSLLNAISGHERAIVTSSAGTTRDIIEAQAHIGGILYKLSDTAGIRKWRSHAEKIGIQRAIKAAKSADLLVFVLDSSKRLGKADLYSFRAVCGRRTIIALNKSDLRRKITEKQAAVFLGIKPGTPVISVSAKNGSGIKKLTKAMKDIIIKGEASDAFVSSRRHRQSLVEAAGCLKEAVKELCEKRLETAAFSLRQAASCAAAITGEIGSEQVLESIFKNFCVGK